jgi:periplasmic protein TonB
VSPVLRLGGYTLSVLLHVGAGALIVAWSATDWTQPLFVDLVEPPEPAGAAGPGSRDGSAARSAPRPFHRQATTRSAALGSRVGASHEASPAPQATAPQSAPSSSGQTSGTISPNLEAFPDTPAQVEPQVQAPLVPAVTPQAMPSEPASPSMSPVSSPTGGRAVASEPGVTGRGAGGTLGATDSGTVSSRGSSFALAAPGTGPGGPGPEYGPYLRRFRERVADALVYPLAARKEGLTGTVELYVRLEATGRVSDVRVVRSSSHEILDDAALETIRRLGPLPFPDSLPHRPLLIRIPLVFELR